MKRYNKSFIGLMEQANDGKWVKFEEADKENSYTLKELSDAKAVIKLAEKQITVLKFTVLAILCLNIIVSLLRVI